MSKESKPPVTLPEILLVDKPKGISSYDVIRKLKKRSGDRKMGHAGTLDPLASGLMIIGVNQGTKKLSGLVELDKTYVAKIILGRQTDSGDLEGEVVKRAEVKREDIDRAELQKVLQSLEGVNRLAVPIYSAVKVGGKPLYEYARKGRDVVVPERDMEVFEAELLSGPDFSQGEGLAEVEFHVASGVYIRSLAEEVGSRLGFPAVLGDLRRTQIGNFDIKDARRIDELV